MTPQVCPSVDLSQIQSLLEKFVEVIKINVYIVDRQGVSLLTPGQNHYGWKLLCDVKYIQDDLKASGDYLEYVDHFGLVHHALPVNQGPIGYVVIGPVIVGKRPDKQMYRELAQKYSINIDDLLESTDEVRMCTNIQVKAILDMVKQLTEMVIAVLKMPSAQGAAPAAVEKPA